MVDEWKRLVHAGETEAVVRDLLALHYDPGYATSTRRNFARFGEALPVVLADRGPQTLARAAEAIVQGQDDESAVSSAASA